MEIDPIVSDIFEEVGNKVATGLGGMLGCELDLPAPTISVVTKKEFFAQTRKKQVMVQMSVSGDQQGDIYVFCRLKDAVHLGGVLIMLPPGELEDRVKKETFGEDESDSFGEIANIISGELCSAFDELHPDKLHFKMAGLELVVPSKVKPTAAEPFPPGHYLMAAYTGSLDGQPLDDLVLLFPAGLLGIEVPEAPAVAEPVAPAPAPASAATGRLVNPEEAAALLGEVSPDAAPAGDVVETIPDQPLVEGGQQLSTAGGGEGTAGEPVILVVAIGGSEGQTISAAINEHGYNARLVDRKDNFNELSKELAGQVKGIVLAMEEVGEQSFSVAIKVRAAFGESVPLMAAGSQWTRSKVLQAVKYGVCDILVTPATADEVQEKVESHFKPSQSVAV